MISCDKICYDEYRDAKAHITGMIKRKGGSYRVYKCDKCGKFHVTTIPKRNKKLKPLKEKNYFVQLEISGHNKIKIPPVNPLLNCNKKQQSIVTTYKPFEYFKTQNT